MKSFVLVICLTLFSTAAATAQGYEIKGAGAESCGTWTQDRSKGTNSQQSGLDEQWVLGFIVGTENLMATLSKTNYTISTDAPGIFGWIDNYCQSRPIDSISLAATSFITESNTVIIKPTN